MYMIFLIHLPDIEYQSLVPRTPVLQTDAS